MKYLEFGNFPSLYLPANKRDFTRRHGALKYSNGMDKSGATQRIPSGTEAICFTQSPDVWLQSLPSQNHRLKAWQKWASMYGCLQNADLFFHQRMHLIEASLGGNDDDLNLFLKIEV